MSSDVILGAPYNMASYSLLLTMVAKVLGYTPWEVTIQTGDTHVYLNHIDIFLKEQLNNPLHPSPKLTITGNQSRLEDFTKDDIHIVRYGESPKIKYPVAV